MKMKPLPKAILILAVVGAVGYFGNEAMNKRKAEAPSVAVEAAVVQTTTGANSPAISNAGTVNVTIPAEPAPASAPAATSSDSGLDSVLKAAASKKK